MQQETIYKRKEFIFYSTICAIFVEFFFAIYNLYLYIKNQDIVGIHMFVYYVLVVIARSIALGVEDRYVNTHKEAKMFLNTYIALSVLMFFIDFSLIWPFIWKVMYPKEFTYGLFPALVYAFYVLGKVIVAVFNYVKVISRKNILFKYLRQLSIIDCGVSAITLQYILIMVFGDYTAELQTFAIITTALILTGILAFSIAVLIVTIKKAKKIN